MQLVGGLLRVVAGIGTDLVPRLSRTAVVRVAALTQAVCLLIVALTASTCVALAVTAMIVSGVASCAWQGAHYAQMAHAAGDRQAGTALGLNNAATSFGAFIPQVAAGVLAIIIGWDGVLVLLGIVPAVVAAFLFPAIPARLGSINRGDNAVSRESSDD